MTKSLHKISSPSLLHLSDVLVHLTDEEPISHHILQQVLGQDLSVEVSDEIAHLRATGWSNLQIVILLNTILETRDSFQDPEKVIDLVLSGPDMSGYPIRDTAAVTYALTNEAVNEIILVGYAVYSAKGIFLPISERMAAHPKLRVRMCLNIARKHQDSSLESEIVRRFSRDFFQHHWPWKLRPELHYDPQSLSTETSVRRSLHAKCVIVDRRAALITSANFTEAAQSKNIEVGVVVTHKPVVERIAGYFDRLCAEVFKRCPDLG